MATDPIDGDGQTPLERLPTGIPGLDTVLRGGFLKAGIYILRGEPGTGKTMLALPFVVKRNDTEASRAASAVELTGGAPESRPRSM